MTERTFLEIWEERQKPAPKTQGQEEEIMRALVAHGVPREDIDTNGYRFTFPYNNLIVEFFDHNLILSGTIHRKPSGTLEKEDLEKRCLQDADTILHTPRFSEVGRLKFVRDFEYKRFQYGGEPADAVQKVIKLAQAPIEAVIARLQKSGMTGYGIVTDSL